ncbi:MAG TPA: ScyD/ScyE family protein [Blastocatellia bacterium]|nr:ScyD/ScyE family protein [Blastocatellia bacterium]
MKKFIVRLATLTLFALTISSASALAQSVVTGGLKAPTRIILTPEGSLIVSETGTGNNDGRISIIDKNGNRRTLVDGLPSGINLDGGEGDPSGPSGIALRGRTIYVLIGAGDSVLPGPVQGSLVPNPQPSSPIFSSLLEIRLDSSPEFSAGNFTLTSDDYDALNEGITLKPKNPSGQKIRVNVLANFKSFSEEPRPDFPANVRNSNPFGLALNKDKLYMTDASQNTLREIDIATGEHHLLARFAPKPNPLPFGPPVVDAVPDNVRVFGKQLLVTYLTGFPFASGLAEVRKINLANNSQTTFIGGLTTAIDVIPVKGANGENQFYTLEISTDLLTGQPGRIQFFSSASAAPVLVAGGLIGPTGFAFDEENGDLYVAELFTGLIKKVHVGQ